MPKNGIYKLFHSGKTLQDTMDNLRNKESQGKVKSIYPWVFIFFIALGLMILPASSCREESNKNTLPSNQSIEEKKAKKYHKRTRYHNRRQQRRRICQTQKNKSSE